VNRRTGAVAAALAVVGTAAAVVTTVVGLRRGDPPLFAVLTGTSSVSYLLVGLLLRLRRPWSRVGLVLTAAAPTWLLPVLQGPDVPWGVRGVALWLGGLPVLLLGHLLLSYPSGRLRTAVERAAVGVGAVVVLPLGFAVTFVVPALAPSLSLVGQGLTVVLAALGLARWRRARGPLRRLLTPVPFAALVFVAGALPHAALHTGLLPLDRLYAASVPAAALQPLVPVAFAVGLLASRRARGGLGDLLVHLDSQPDGDDVRAALARALRDPTAQVGYAVPGRDGYVDVDGAPVRLPDDDDPDRRSVVLRDGDAPVAVVVHDAALAEERELLDAVLAAARLRLVNERLRAAVQAQLEDVRASRARLVEAGDEARRRLERDLHDGAQQRLVALALHLGDLERAVGAADEEELRARVSALRADAATAVAELRALARGLHPVAIDDVGLCGALEDLARRSPVTVRVQCHDTDLPTVTAATVYYVVAEALTNAVKHAGAELVVVDVRDDGEELRVEVVDDGHGGARLQPGGGLSGLDDRVVALGGELAVLSTASGTTVRARVPRAAAAVGPARPAVLAG
jgi:signal transduction histidine kinase